MLTTATFQRALQRLISPQETPSFLLAVSGGVDSMVMADLFLKTDLSFGIAHVNYHLRGEESNGDQVLVEKFSAKHEISFHLYEVSEKDKKSQNSIQVWARELRYEFFKKLQSEFQYDYIVTAHHLNDQLETFLINLSKASGIKGLSGISANENKIVRPLLEFSRDEIEEYAKKEKIEFRTDSSNLKSDYLRNFIRNEISPKLFKTNENFLQNFEKSLQHLQQVEHFSHNQIKKIETEITIKNGDSLLLDKDKLLKQDAFVHFEILRKYGFESPNEIQKIFKAEKGKIFKSATHLLKVDRDFLAIESLEVIPNNILPEFIVVLEESPDENFELDLSSHLSPNLPNDKRQHWEIDADKISFPLIIRPKNSEDLFFPIGMSGRKKVSKFFKDEKIPTFAQHKIWLLCDNNNDVVGVLPYRQDRRFMKDQNTTRKISIKW